MTADACIDDERNDASTVATADDSDSGTATMPGLIRSTEPDPAVRECFFDLVR